LALLTYFTNKCIVIKKESGVFVDMGDRMFEPGSGSNIHQRLIDFLSALDLSFALFDDLFCFHLCLTKGMCKRQLF
jgi:hypothetical protein